MRWCENSSRLFVPWNSTSAISESPALAIAYCSFMKGNGSVRKRPISSPVKGVDWRGMSSKDRSLGLLIAVAENRWVTCELTHAGHLGWVVWREIKDVEREIIDVERETIDR